MGDGPEEAKGQRCALDAAVGNDGILLMGKKYRGVDGNGFDFVAVRLKFNADEGRLERTSGGNRRNG